MEISVNRSSHLTRHPEHVEQQSRFDAAGFVVEVETGDWPMGEMSAWGTTSICAGFNLSINTGGCWPWTVSVKHLSECFTTGKGSSYRCCSAPFTESCRMNMWEQKFRSGLICGFWLLCHVGAVALRCLVTDYSWDTCDIGSGMSSGWVIVKYLPGKQREVL